MKLAIMQPYFFPYIGYFSLIAATDYWIIFDTPQYIRKGWVNRNRILKKGGDWKYIGIPVKKASRETPINEIQISQSIDWREDIINNLDDYRDRKAPFYEAILDFLKITFSIQETKLSSLLTHFLKCTCEYIGLSFNYQIFSEMDLSIGEVNNPGEWALKISESLGAKTYINAPGGREIFNKTKFEDSRIELLFIEPILKEYNQKRQDFISGLSIIDVLMWNSPEHILEMITKYELSP